MYRVRVHAVAPGFIESDMLNPISEKVKQRILWEIPLSRFGKPEEVACLGCTLSPLTLSQ
jgi:NAD(P)-dependent dehydrogenase (short-subunit alcohol dehydrogenase family)